MKQEHFYHFSCVSCLKWLKKSIDCIAEIDFKNNKFYFFDVFKDATIVLVIKISNVSVNEDETFTLYGYDS